LICSGFIALFFILLCAGDARKNIEAQTGKPVITSDNAARLNEVVTGMIESVVSSEENNDK